MGSRDAGQAGSLRPQRRARRWAGGGMVLAALMAGAAAGAIALWPRESHPRPAPVPTTPPILQPLGIASVDYPTPLPTRIPDEPLPAVDWVRPTAAADVVAAALEDPLAAAPELGTVQRKLDPLTIIPARTRGGIVTYRVARGDNLQTIAQKFNLQESTIIWSNDRFYVNAMRIGMELTILPVDGVYHHVPEAQTIASIAEEYKVSPYAIIDSEYNGLFNASPESVLPAGYAVIVPGGTGSTQPIYWDPGIVVSTKNASGAVGTGVNAGTDFASFAIGDPGSCGKQPVMGGSPPYSAPIHRSYRITQDFSWVHGGIDLAVPVGTDVFAAGGGTVIFSGESTWGYGYTVVIAHGGTLTIYGHLNGAFVSCGQVVTAGQGIAVTGNSGRSSGPHLHFEVRGPGGAPTSPWDYQQF